MQERFAGQESHREPLEEHHRQHALQEQDDHEPVVTPQAELQNATAERQALIPEHATEEAADAGRRPLLFEE